MTTVISDLRHWEKGLNRGNLVVFWAEETLHLVIRGEYKVLLSPEAEEELYRNLRKMRRARKAAAQPVATFSQEVLSPVEVHPSLEDFRDKLPSLEEIQASLPKPEPACPCQTRPKGAITDPTMLTQVKREIEDIFYGRNDHQH